ncbi:MAG: hypothetical protein Q9166_004870 [cf. Caloplaca sp. 2 TL-2023]
MIRAKETHELCFSSDLVPEAFKGAGYQVLEEYAQQSRAATAKERLEPLMFRSPMADVRTPGPTQEHGPPPPRRQSQEASSAEH